MRNIVSSILDIDARKVELSGTIDPETSWGEDGGHSWWDGAAEDYFTVYGFNPKDGLVALDIQMSYAYSQNGEPQPEGESETLSEFMARDTREFIFFVVDHTGKNYGESGERFRQVTVFKAPDFQAYWNRVNNEDVARWSKWLNEG